MKKEKRIIAVAVILLVAVLIFVNNLINRPAAYDPSETDGYNVSFASSESSDKIFDMSVQGMQKVGESGSLRLYYDASLEEIAVENTKTGYIWKSACEGTELKQLCNVTLINTDSDNTLAVNNAANECEINVVPLKNGVKLSHYYVSQGFGFDLELWLENGRLWAKIPISSITENDLFSVLSIDVLPYLGAVPAGQNGYILFPDGSGAIYDFSQKTVATSPVTLDVYSDRVTDVDELLNDKKSGVHPVRLPVYGVSCGNDAVVAYIADGAASSSVTLEPSGYVCNVNRVYGTGVYRKVTEVVSEAGISSYQSDGRIGIGDFSVCYQFLNNQDADYSGMAKAVRSLMSEYGLLPENNGADIGLKLDVVMGAEEKTMVGRSYRTVTTLSQLSEMFSKLTSTGRKTEAVLVGWQKQGYGVYPDTAKSASSIGKLSKFEVPDGVDMFLDCHTVFADKGRSGAILRRDGIRNSKRVTILGDKNATYIINANTQLKLFEKLLPKYDFSGKYGLEIFDAGSVLYDDYNTRCGMNRQQTANSLCAVLDKAGEKNPLMVSEPNSYALRYANFVSGLYQDASGYHILGKSVPFYQLVISGTVPYSLDVAGNLSSDFRFTRLRWAEYGAVPYFVVSADGSNALSDTPADVFFAIDFDEQIENINKTVSEFDELYKKLGNRNLCKHTFVADGVYRSDFENGYSVFVNYNEKDVNVQGIKIPAMDYTVQKGADR